MWKQIHLVEQYCLDFVKHHRIFLGFVSSLYDAEDHDPQVLAKIEFNRANKVAHILYEQKVKRGEIYSMECVMDHSRIQVAYLAGGYLVRGDPKRFYSVGVY